MNKWEMINITITNSVNFNEYILHVSNNSEDWETISKINKYTSKTTGHERNTSYVNKDPFDG